MTAHTVCEAGDYRDEGCGHPLALHSAGMRCRVCGVECGLHPRARGWQAHYDGRGGDAPRPTVVRSAQQGLFD